MTVSIYSLCTYLHILLNTNKTNKILLHENNVVPIQQGNQKIFVTTKWMGTTVLVYLYDWFVFFVVSLFHFFEWIRNLIFENN